MPVTEDDVRRALRSVRYPGFTRDIVAFDILRDLTVSDGAVAFRIEIGQDGPTTRRGVKRTFANEFALQKVTHE